MKKIKLMTEVQEDGKTYRFSIIVDSFKNKPLESSDLVCYITVCTHDECSKWVSSVGNMESFEERLWDEFQLRPQTIRVILDGINSNYHIAEELLMFGFDFKVIEDLIAELEQYVDKRSKDLIEELKEKDKVSAFHIGQSLGVRKEICERIAKELGMTIYADDFNIYKHEEEDSVGELLVYPI